jgi:hypothetical protein
MDRVKTERQVYQSVCKSVEISMEMFWWQWESKETRATDGKHEGKRSIFELWLINGNGKELMECMSDVKCRQLYGADFIQSLLWTNSELQGDITRKARKKLNFLSICEFSGVQKRIIAVQVNVVR